MGDSVEYPYYTQAAVISFLSALSMILTIPPALWHFRHRNIAATTLVCWFTVQNSLIFINSLIWPDDDRNNWFDGAIYCDIQIHILLFSFMSCAGCLLCIMRGLARVLDTNDIIVAPSRTRRIRRAAFDIFWCFGFPAVMTSVYYAVQSFRYWVRGIIGCVAPFDNSWLGILLVPVPPFILSITTTFYAILVLYRTYRYRKEFSHILAASNTTPSCFLRLFIISAFFLAGILPFQAYVIYTNVHNSDYTSYSWARVHNSDWNVALLVPSQGSLPLDYWVTVALGYVLFAFFGLGSEALEMYRACATKLRITWLCLYCFSPARSRRAGSSGGAGNGGYTRANSVSSLASKAREVLGTRYRSWTASSSFSTSVTTSSHSAEAKAPRSKTRRMPFLGFWKTFSPASQLPRHRQDAESGGTRFSDPFGRRKGSAATESTFASTSSTSTSGTACAGASGSRSGSETSSSSSPTEKVFPRTGMGLGEGAERASSAAEAASAAKKREKVLVEARKLEEAVLGGFIL